GGEAPARAPRRGTCRGPPAPRLPRPGESGTPRPRPRRRWSPRSADSASSAAPRAPSCRLRHGGEELGDGGDVALPGDRLGAQLLTSSRRQLVELGPLPLVRESPFGLSPAALLESVQ